MSRRRRQGLSPSLFPFLAVLVCTLGTLILLLALVAQNAATAAAVEQKEEQEEQSNRLSAANAQALIDEAEFRVEQLVAFRDQQVADIGDRRDQLTHIDDHMRRIRDEMKRLNDEVRMTAGRAEVVSVDQTQLDRLKAEIDAEEKRVDDLKQRQADQTPRVVIVPHKGPNGTDRRPVYLECTADGLTIWPEGTRLAEIYLKEAVDQANPLDAALRVIRHHALQNYGDAVAPYPLLVVRPDGIETYAAARQAMRDWDDQFGYELIPADVKLAYDTPDPALKKKVDYAIRQAIIKQNGLQRLAAGLSGRGGGNGQFGGLRRYPTLSAASMDRQGRASGFRDHRDGFPRGNPYAQSANPTQYGDLGTGVGTGADAASRLEQQLREARGEVGSGGNPDGPLGNSFPDGAAQSAGARTRIADLAMDSIGKTGEGSGQSDGLGTSVGSGLVDGAESKAAGAQDPTRRGAGQQAGQGELALEGPGGSEGDEQASEHHLSDQRGHATGQQGHSTSQQGHSTSQPAPSSDQQAHDQRGSQQLNPFANESQAGQQGKQQGKPGSSAQASSANQNAAAAQNNNQQVSNGSSATSPPPGASGMTMPDITPPSLDLNNLPKTPPSLAKELVRRQGNNWALPESVAMSSGNAVVRTIRVQCYPDRFVLLAPRSEGRIEMFGMSDGDINRATMELATAIRDRIVRWGAALPGGRWQPRLDVEIMKHGDRRFHQLRMLMRGSGVEVEGRPSR